MKKLAVCLILSLVMCLAMAFSASAATVNRYDWAEKYDPILDYMLSQRPAGYNYHAVLLSGSGNIVAVYFFKTSVISSTAMSYYRMSYTVSTGVYSSLTNYPDGVFYWFLNSTTPPAINLVTTGAQTISYYVVDRSTVKPYNHSEAENKWKDVEWQINLGPHWPYPDTSALQALINTAKSKTNTGYTNASWQTLQSSITAAENLLKTTGYTQSQVDSAKNTLQTALNGLQLLPDTTALQSLINQAKGMEGNYTPESWQALQLAITDAENLLKTTDYTQSQVDNAKASLQSALNSLELLPDTAELRELLVEADQIDDIGYTVPTWTRFDNARADGHSLMARPSYTQPEVNATTFELASSMSGLVMLPGTSYLTALLADADLITDIGYTSSTWTRFINARSSGHALLNLTNYTVFDVSDCVTELMQAMNGLTLVPTNPPVVPPVATPGIPPPQYYAIPPGSMQYLDIADGYTPEHLAPIKESLMQNLDASRKFGLPLYFISLIPLLTVIIIRKCIHMESHTIDIYPRTRLSDARTYNPYKMGSGSSKYD